ncbi:MAG: LysR family transcriptional regulator [Verrucomicrobiota bacterium]
MQIQSLKVFSDLAETESFTKAAQINGITQSAVSQQIGSLEKQFETLLIERSKKKFRLTREGNVLYGTASKSSKPTIPCSITCRKSKMSCQEQFVSQPFIAWACTSCRPT